MIMVVLSSDGTQYSDVRSFFLKTISTEAIGKQSNTNKNYLAVTCGGSKTTVPTYPLPVGEAKQQYNNLLPFWKLLNLFFINKSDRA